MRKYSMHCTVLVQYTCACESHASSRGFSGLLALTTMMSKQQSLGSSKGRKAPSKVSSPKGNKRGQLSLSKRQTLNKPDSVKSDQEKSNMDTDSTLDHVYHS